MEEVKPKVFVSSNNVFVTDAITAAGVEHTKDKNDADIIVCVMHCAAAVGQTSERDKEFKTFKREVESHINEKINTPVVLVYTTMTGGREEDGDVTSRLENLGQELGITSLNVVRNSIQFELGKEELKQKLEQFRSAEQMSKIMVARETRKEKQEQAALPSSRPVEQSQPVVQLPRKKVFIVSNDLKENKDKVSGLIKGRNYDVVELQNEADVIVVAFNISDKTQTATAFFDSKWQELKDTNKNVIFTFVSDVSEIGQSFMAVKDTFSQGLLAQQKSVEEAVSVLVEKLEHDQLPQRSQICKPLLNYPGGEEQLGNALTNAAKPVQERNVSVVKPVSFFKYPEERSFCHSRQIRNEYFEKHLKINAGDDDTTKRKKLFLLLAHYKSLRHTIFNIGHVDSWLSKKIEDELARNLMEPQAYKAYTENKDKKRTSNLGKCFDPFAKKLEKLFLKKYPRSKAGEKNGQLLDNLIKLLSYADRRERRSFFNGKENQTFIKNIIEAADLVYNKKIRPEVDAEAEKKPDTLPWYAQRIYDRAIRSDEPRSVPAKAR